MIQKLIEKLNKKRLKERISSAIVMVALIVSISGVVGAVSGIIVSNRYNYALKNYGFSQGDIGKMMITFADTRSYLRAAIGYQDENLVNSCAENYEKKKESCQQYTKEVKNTVSSADEEKIYNSITEKLNDYFDTCDAVLEKGKNTQDIDARHEAQQMAQDQVAPIYEEIYQDMVKLMDANTEHGDKLEKILTMVELITLIAIIAVIALAIFAARRIGRVLAQNIVDPLDQLGARFDTFAKGDLSSEFPEMTSEDEISEMVVVAREMAKNLAAVIQDVNHRMDLMAHNDYTGVSKIPEKYMGEFALALSASVPSPVVVVITFKYLSSGGILVSPFLSVISRVIMSPAVILPESPAARLLTVKLTAFLSPSRLANASFTLLPVPDSFSFFR
jgi:methyl-accepting chemotaxis protein